MKQTIVILTIFLIFSFLMQGNSQVNIRGSLQSSLYSWENFQQTKFLDYYQGLSLRVSPENYSNLYLSTFLRGARRGDPAEWEERVYNMYVNWDITKKYQVRIGRQFLYNGVMNGTIDGVLLSGKVFKNLQVKALVGTEATLQRTLKIRDWDNGNVLGGYISYTLPWQNRIQVSYFQKERLSEMYWQQLGASFRGYLYGNLNYYARLDYNLLKSEYQTMRFRLSYYVDKWSATAEFSSMRPRIYEDSFFNIFDVKAHNQIRAAGTYQVGKYQLGLQYLYTIYEVHDFYILHKDDNDNRIIASVSSKYGTLGAIYQTGFGGENIGYYAEIRYEVLPNLTAKLYNSFYNYERATTNISEDALAFSAGLSYRFRKLFIFNGEIQESQNSYFENDWRGLFRITYLFNY